MSRVFESVLQPASGGFGMWDMGEYNLCEGVESLDEWAAAANENGLMVREAPEIDGRIYGQNQAAIYACTPYDPKTGETDEANRSYHAVRVEAEE